MNLLIVNQEYPPSEGGAANACRHLAHALVGLGHAVTVVTGRPAGPVAPDAGAENTPGCAVIRVPVPGYRGGPFRVRDLALFAARALPVCGERMDRARCDGILAFFTLPAAGMALRLSRRSGCPFIVSLRGSDVPGFRYSRWAPPYLLARPLIRRIWREASAVVANSTALRNLAWLTWRGPIETIPNGVDCLRFAPPPDGRRGRDALQLLTVGQLIHRKNPLRLIAAFAELNRRVATPVRLRLVGRGPLESNLRAQARALGVEGLVEFAGFVPPERMPAEYAAADAFVLLSSREGMSNALLEAMASGLPCVVARAGDSEKLIASPGEGLVLDETESPVEPLAALMDDPDRRLALGAAARRRVQESFTWESAARRYADMFGRAVRKDIPCPDRQIGAGGLPSPTGRMADNA
jgi:glycogen(starch) synthase